MVELNSNSKSTGTLLKAILLIHETPTVLIAVAELEFSDEPTFRDYGSDSIMRLAKSLAFGIVNPILINTSCTIIDGEARVRAAQYASISEVPCKTLDLQLTEKEWLELRVTLNPLRKILPWVRTALNIELDQREYDREQVIRARKAITLRSQADIDLQKLQTRYDTTLTEVALEAVNCIRGLDSIKSVIKESEFPENLQQARQLLTESIRLICGPSALQKKN